MSKLPRALILGAMLVAMSLGSTAHAQTSDTPSQPAGASQPGQDPAPDPGSTTTTTTTTTTPTAPPALLELTVGGSSRQGRLGTTVALIADLRSCPQPISASGVFLDHAGTGRPLTGLTVASGRLTARYTVGARDAVGWGHFKITCWRDTPAGATPAGVGNWSFQVRAVAGRTPSHGPNNNPPNGGPQVNYGNDGTVQLPSEIDTGQGGTADGIHHPVMDPVWLMPLAGLMLIAVAVGLRLRHTTSRRRP
jgi:hypothetical protein